MAHQICLKYFMVPNPPTPLLHTKCMVLKQVSICINFLLNANWRRIAWLSIFWNLHIFIGVQQICDLLKAKRKVKILIFIIWNSHGRSGPEVISVGSHTSLRVFTALGQFRQMVMSPQIMRMNKQISLYSYYASKLVSFKPRVLQVLEHLGI